MKTSKMSHLFAVSTKMNVELMAVHERFGGFISSAALSKGAVMVNDHEAFYGGEDCSTFLYGGMKFSVTAWDTCFAGNHRTVRPVWKNKTYSSVDNLNTVYPTRRGKKRIYTHTFCMDIMNEWDQSEMFGTITFSSWIKEKYPKHAKYFIRRFQVLLMEYICSQDENLPF